MQGYIYLTTNKINNKKYVGRKTSNVFIESYLGSGRHLKNAIKKYGKENFHVEVLEEVNDKYQLIPREMYWIAHFNAVEDNMFYNHSPGGYNEGFEPGKNNIAKTDRSRKINSDKHKGKKYSKEIIKKRSETFRKNQELGLHTNYHPEFSDEWRKQQSERAKEFNSKRDYSIVSKTTTGKKFMNKDGIQTWVAKDDIQKYLDNGWKFGECKKRAPKKTPPWNKGKHGCQIAHNSNKIWINNGVINKFIFKEELDEYKQLGFVKGMKPRGNKPTD